VDSSRFRRMRAMTSGVRDSSLLRPRTGLLNDRCGRERTGVDTAGEFRIVEGLRIEVGVDGSAVEADVVGVDGRRRGDRNGAFSGVNRRRFGSRSSMVL
jgi:hypothetical protein